MELGGGMEGRNSNSVAECVVEEFGRRREEIADTSCRITRDK